VGGGGGRPVEKFLKIQFYKKKYFKFNFIKK
jgi:hypothetical protein